MTEKKQSRSPNFPAISLPQAINRVAELNDTIGQDTRHASLQDAEEAWGISERSSQMNQVCAALRAYGLVEYQNTDAERLLRITGEADAIRRHEPHRPDCLLRAFLKPDMFREVWNYFKEEIEGEILSETELYRYLVSTRTGNKFSDSAANNFCDSFLYSLELIDREAIPQADTQGIFPADRPAAIVGGGPAFFYGQSPASTENSVPISIPMSDGEIRVVNIPKMDRRSYEMFAKLLEAYESAIVNDTQD